MKYIFLIGLFAAGFVAGINIESFDINSTYAPQQWKVFASIGLAIFFIVSLVVEPKQ